MTWALRYIWFESIDNSWWAPNDILHSNHNKQIRSVDTNYMTAYNGSLTIAIALHKATNISSIIPPQTLNFYHIGPKKNLYAFSPGHKPFIAGNLLLKKGQSRITDYFSSISIPAIGPQQYLIHSLVLCPWGIPHMWCGKCNLRLVTLTHKMYLKVPLFSLEWRSSSIPFLISLKA